MTRYYTVERNQKRYFRCANPETQAAKDWCYKLDFSVNCSGDCFITADGTNLRYQKPYEVAACPPTFPLGTRLHVENIGDVTCHDRGGAIKGNRLDLWSGIGDGGLTNLYDRPETSGFHKVWKYE